jgi:hypothetical protein
MGRQLIGYVRLFSTQSIQQGARAGGLLLDLRHIRVVRKARQNVIGLCSESGSTSGCKMRG